MDRDGVTRGLASSLRRVGGKVARRVANRLGYSLVAKPHLRALNDSLQNVGLSDSKDNLSQRADTQVSIDTAQLRELEDKYRVHPLTRLSGLWTETHTSYIPLTNFRGDSPIVWQGGPYGDLRYLVTIQHVLAHDRHHLLDMLEEDGALGATVLEFEGKLYSRDLLDSACEITFLLDHITRDTLNGSRIVDIGAGYGRLAHRLAALLPEAQIFCVDGIAVSTKICDAYIQFRHLQAQVKTVPLTELDSIPGPIFLATNVHSFSEMSRPAIAWWLDWLLDVGIYYLFIVPNLPGPSVRDGTSFRDLLDKRGFALVTSRAKFDDHLMDRYGLYPDVYYLFRHCGNADPSRTV